MNQMTIYYLEMQCRSQLIAKTKPDGLTVVKVKHNQHQFNRFLYQLVGEAWQWTDKLSDTDEQWKRYVDNPNLHTWVAYSDGAIAGYFELYSAENGETEICYFGLSPQFIGKGYGGYLLSDAIKKAWNISTTKRVWVHTCSLDHPAALANYQARGLSLYKTEVE